MKISIFHKILLFFSVVIIATSLFTSSVWAFLPFSIYMLSRISKPLGLLLACLLFFLSWQGVGGDWIYSDVFVLGFLAFGGLLLTKTRARLSELLKSLCVYSVFVGLFFGLWWFNSSDPFWISQRMDSQILPGFLRAGAWAGREEIYFGVFRPIFEATWLAWTSFSILAILVFDALASRLFELELKGVKAHRRFWTEFSQWRAPEWVLVPWVAAILCLLVFYRAVVPRQLEWAPTIGWNVFVLCLFPLAFAGLSLFSWLFPRLPLFLLVLMLLMTIYLDPAALLILAGLADIWFDFRTRMRSNPLSGFFKDEE